MRHLAYAFLLAVIISACYSREHNRAIGSSLPYARNANDSTIHGLVCDGSNDTIIIFLHDPYDGADPGTLNILQASKEGHVFGMLKIGNKVALMRDSADSTKASLVIITEDLLGQWCYKEKPRLRRRADMEGMSERQMQTLLPDTIQKLLEEEREYGFILKIDSLAMPIGQRGLPSSPDESNPLEFPKLKLYRNWYIQNGRLMLVEIMLDSLGNMKPINTDTAEIVLLTPDTLVLRFAEGERSYYHKTETAE